MPHGFRLNALVGACLAILANGAAAGPIQTLLSEDFQDVTGLGTASTVRTVSSVLADSPNPLAGSPTATFANTGNGNASANAFNVRRGDNAIDGTNGMPTLGNVHFDNFFGGSANRFLVIGDNSGNLGGNANGGSNGAASSTMSIRFALAPISIKAPDGLDVWFDFVFDADNAANADDFIAELILADASTYTLLNFAAPTATTRGTFNAYIPFADFPAAPTHLNFRLVEYSGTGSSAVGLDNLQVNAVPEPGALALLGIGLVGMGLLRRKAA